MKGNIFLSLILQSQMSCSVYSTIISEFNATPKIQQILTDVGGKWWDRVKLHLTFIDYGFRSLSPSGQRFPDKSYGQSMLRTTSYDWKIRGGKNLLSSGRQNFFKKGLQLGWIRLSLSSNAPTMSASFIMMKTWWKFGLFLSISYRDVRGDLEDGDLTTYSPTHACWCTVYVKK